VRISLNIGLWCSVLVVILHILLSRVFASGLKYERRFGECVYIYVFLCLNKIFLPLLCIVLIGFDVFVTVF